jgi:hypothetical protein
MLVEIRNIVQRNLERRKRWFHDDDFDLYVWQAPDAQVLELQLCYERGTHRERALTWKRGMGYANYAVDSGEASPMARQTPMLVAGGRFGGWRIRERLVAAAGDLEPAIAAFVLDKVAEHCDPPRRFQRRGRSAPDWLRRIRTAELKRSMEMHQ